MRRQTAAEGLTANTRLLDVHFRPKIPQNAVRIPSDDTRFRRFTPFISINSAIFRTDSVPIRIPPASFRAWFGTRNQASGFALLRPSQ